MNVQEPLVQARDLCKYFTTNKTIFHKGSCLKALEHINLEIYEGETLGIVGESGCGKSTLGRCLLRLYEATSGTILYRGADISQYDANQMRLMRQKLQIVFQDPYASLNPRMTVEEAICSPLDVFKIGTPAERKARAYTIARKVGLNDYHMQRYPHEFSGGQRQRVVIARALILNPEFVVCDEPVSALDVSVRSQVLNLLQDMQRELHLTYLFISHDLSVVRYISDRIIVMYLGSIMEIADRRRLFENPSHPYTQALISAIPVPGVFERDRGPRLTGDIPSPLNPPLGCRFASRCPFAMKECSTQQPTLTEIEPGHYSACFHSQAGA